MSYQSADLSYQFFISAFCILGFTISLPLIHPSSLILLFISLPIVPTTIPIAAAPINTGLSGHDPGRHTAAPSNSATLVTPRIKK